MVCSYILDIYTIFEDYYIHFCMVELRPKVATLGSYVASCVQLAIAIAIC